MYNPTRRNRNIGTEKQGYGKNNKLKYPESKTLSLNRYQLPQLFINHNVILFYQQLSY